MTRKAGEVLPADLVPCKDFEMSQTFQDWAVDSMRKEVLGQVSKAGLNRMAIVKGKGPDGEGGAAEAASTKPSPNQGNQRKNK